MKIHFLGGSDEVGASCLLVEIGGQNILVDAGIRVSPKARDGLSGELLPDLSILSRKKPDAIIVTHAHADHIGAVPLVIGSMPDIPVYTTPATISLMSVMFRDALKIMDTRMEAEGELPTYDQLQVQQVENACRPTDFKQEFSINDEVNVTFYRAGHIPGAASVHLQSDNGSVLISGDLSFSAMRATPIAEIPPVRPDALVLETTYGGKLHANRLAEEQRLIDAVKRILEGGGRVLFPAFALGRAQEIALILDAAIASKKLDPVQIYMDGITRAITQVFERFPDYLSKGLQKHLEDSLNLFRTKNVHFIRSRAERDELAIRKTPCIIIASSGMLTGGASPVYAQHIVSERPSAIFITGYQDEESPGRVLQGLASKESNSVTLFQRKFQVECTIDTYALSAHADENELTQYAAQLEPKMVYLVHGDRIPRERMRDLIQMRKIAVHMPRIGDHLEVDGSKVVGRRKGLPQIPEVITPPITSLEDLDSGLPLYNSEGELYIRNARKAIRKALPVETGLRKMSFNSNERTIKLHFDFPTVAEKNFAEQIAVVRQMVGWEVEIHEAVNMDALHHIAKNMLPGMIGRASIFMAERVVEIILRDLPPNWQEIQAAYVEQTGYRLIVKSSAMKLLASKREQVESTPAPVAPQSLTVAPNPNTPLMEINEAYGLLKQAFREDGLYKTGLKNGTIVLSFITPEAGMLHAEKIRELSETTGYPLTIHPHPNQHALIMMILEMCEQRDIMLIKNPSLMVSEQVMNLEIADQLEEAALEELQNGFHKQTGWHLAIKVVQ